MMIYHEVSLWMLASSWCGQDAKNVCRERSAYLATTLAKLTSTVFRGLARRGGGTVDEGVFVLSAWPLRWPLGEAFLGFFARPLLEAAIAAAPQRASAADIWSVWTSNELACLSAVSGGDG